MMLKAIETRYHGYRFRSRLEARWAVFFTALGLRWEYEAEGFDLDAGWYLPDFFLPDLNGGVWVEVKPDTNGPLNDQRWYELVHRSEKGLLLATGVPEIRIYSLLCPEDESSLGWGIIGPHWCDVCFNKKYLPPRNHDGVPRIFWQPGGIEDANCFDEVEAAKSARFEHGEVPA